MDPHWIVDAVATIVRHDLDLKIRESGCERVKVGENINTNCPFVTSFEAAKLWEANPKLKMGIEKAYNEKFVAHSEEPYSFLERLLVYFSILVPVKPEIVRVAIDKTNLNKLGDVYFLPSLLNNEAAESWDFKKTQSWQTTLCTSWRVLDFVPPGLFEKIIAKVLQKLRMNVYLTRAAVNHIKDSSRHVSMKPLQIHVWKTAFSLEMLLPDGRNKVHIFAQITDHDSEECIASNVMEIGESKNFYVLIECF